MTELEALNTAYVKIGGVPEMARRLETTRQAIYQWKRCPPGRVLAVEKMSGVSRHDLRPDLYPRPASRSRSS